MDNTPATNSDRSLQNHYGNTLPESNRCRYCGAVLNPEFYFCTYCSTPYRNYLATLPDQPVKPIEARTRLKKGAPGVEPLFWTLTMTLIALAVVMAFLPEEVHGMYLVVQSIVLLLVVGGFCLAHHRMVAEQLLEPGFLHWEAWAGLAALVPMLAINLAYHGLFRWLAGEQDGGGYYQRFQELGLDKGTTILIVAVAPGVIEELAFRGMLLPWLENAFGSRKALWYSSGMFMALHFSVISAPYLLGVGLLLGWTRQRTRSLYPSILIHFLHNFAVLQLGG